MKNEVSKEHLEGFRNKLVAALAENKRKLEWIETVIWEKENCLALWWNKRWSSLYEMKVHGKELVAKHSIRYGFQRWDLQDLINSQTSLLERIDFAIESNCSVVLEDSDYKLIR